MNKELLNLFNVTELYKLPDAIMSILFNEDKRNDIMSKALQLMLYDLSYDWFQELYESEMSERKQKKQDFTPAQLGQLCSMIVGEHYTIHEPTAGNGSMIISDWWQVIQKYMPWEFQFIPYNVDCWELSDRSIPILLFNLSIRGINAIVHHGDVLTGEEKARYILTNNNDILSFSKIEKQ